jgi:hypothetical protein
MTEPDPLHARWREASRRYRERHLEQVRVSDREAARRYAQSDKGRLGRHRRHTVDIASGKEQARWRVAYALRKGTLMRQPCVQCGDFNVHAHHHNGYDSPLDVTWLCAVHHKEAHRGT